MLFSPQIPLQLEPRRDQRFEDFVRGPNAAAVEALESVLDDSGVIIYLRGPASSGKTHLLTALCLRARERGLGQCRDGSCDRPYER